MGTQRSEQESKGKSPVWLWKDGDTIHSDREDRNRQGRGKGIDKFPLEKWGISLIILKPAGWFSYYLKPCSEILHTNCFQIALWPFTYWNWETHLFWEIGEFYLHSDSLVLGGYDVVWNSIKSAGKPNVSFFVQGIQSKVGRGKDENFCPTWAKVKTSYYWICSH